MVLFQKFVRRFGPSTKMAPTAELSLTWDPMGNSHKNLLLRNHWANCNQTLVEWSMNDPLPKLCPVILTFKQDGRQAKNRKIVGWNLEKIFSSETTEPISTKLCWNDPWVLPFQNCVAKFVCGGHLGRRVEPPDTFLEEHHPMTISSKFSSYWANGFRQEDFYGNL
jgi:hypothetical protein